MRISPLAARTRKTVRVALVAASLVGASFTAMTSASASGGGCTGSDPELCFGVNGTALYVNWIQVQAHTDAPAKVYEGIFGPGGKLLKEAEYNVAANQWAPPLRDNINADVPAGKYCGETYLNDKIPTIQYCIQVS